MRFVCGATVLLLFQYVDCYYYDLFTTEIVSPDQVLRTAHKANFRDCSVAIKHCSPSEPRRVGDACNNLKRPSEAINRNQFSRLLPPRFEPNNTYQRFAEDGSELPLAREVRTVLQKSARVVSKRFSMTALHYGGFFASDITRIDGPPNYLVFKTDCCKHSAETDPKCMPLRVPKNDEYYRGTGVRCMNLTRALSFQEVGCVTNDVPYSIINNVTPLLDLQAVYGANDTVTNRIRTFVGGQIRMEYRKNRSVPPGKATNCFANEDPEPCYEVGDTSTNLQPKLVIYTIWFTRLHNAIASQLSLINQCWDDEHLFQTAREINIAIQQKIIFYDFLPLILGRDRMLEAKLITKEEGYMSTYDPHLDARTLAETASGFRILHSLLDDSFGLYDKSANLVAVTSLNLYMFGVGALENKDNMETMGRSLFYQASGDSRQFADTSMSNNMYTKFHKANDLFAIDIQRHREFGMRSYNMYRQVCGLPKAKHFDDLIDVMDSENIQRLKKLYHSVDAIELSAGLITERELPGAAVGPVLWCILGEQAKRLRNSDRFWFENEKVKTKLSLEQLKEIRSYTLSRVACDTADGIFKVQPDAFKVVSKKNPLISCNDMPHLNVNLWKDEFCRMAPKGRIN